MTRTLFPPITPADIAKMEQRARAIGPANCWTGTSVSSTDWASATRSRSTRLDLMSESGRPTSDGASR
jgi:hypothetical protein